MNKIYKKIKIGIFILMIGMQFIPEILMASDTGAKDPGTMADDGSVGTLEWWSPNNAKNHNSAFAETQYIESGESHYLNATNFSFSIPVNATIKGILVEIEKRGSQNYGYIYDNSVRLRKASGLVGDDLAKLEDEWPLSATYISYGSSTELWGTSWSYSDINNIAFGVSIQNWYDSIEGEDTGGIDHIRITVYYTEATSKKRRRMF